MSCVTVPDSDEEHRSPAKGQHAHQQQQNYGNNSGGGSNNNGSYVVREIKHEPSIITNSTTSYVNGNSSGSNSSSMSQKKRLLAKAQTECMANSKPKQEQQQPSLQHQLHMSGDAYNSLDYGSDRPSMSHQPCDFSNNDSLHFQSPQGSQQVRGSYRSDYDQQQQHRDYLQPPAAHRQQRYDAELQQQREQNGYYSKLDMLRIFI